MFWILAFVAVGAGLFCELAPNRRLMVMLKLVLFFSFLIAAFIAYRLSVNQYLVVDMGILATTIMEFRLHRKREKPLQERKR